MEYFFLAIALGPCIRIRQPSLILILTLIQDIDYLPRLNECQLVERVSYSRRLNDHPPSSESVEFGLHIVLVVADNVCLNISSLSAVYNNDLNSTAIIR